MKSKFIYGLVLAISMSLTSCVSDDSKLDDLKERYESVLAANVKGIEWDNSDLSESETIPAGSNDYVENSVFNYTVRIAFSDEGTVVTGDKNVLRSITVNGGRVTVQSGAKGVEYVLSGNTTKGFFKIYSDNKFKLMLDGVSIANPEGSAINNQGGKSVYVVLATGKVNNLSDGPIYNTMSGEDEKGAFFSEGQLIFSGNGTLNVNAVGKNGIVSDDYVCFRPGNKINVTSTAGHGVKANDGIFVRGGVLNVNVSANGTKGINSDANIVVEGGRTTVITSGASLVENNDTSSCAAAKCDSTFTLIAGVMNLKSTGEGGKGINSSNNIKVSGGQLNIVTFGSQGLSSPKGLKADGNISVSGGQIYIYSASAAPMEALGQLLVAPNYQYYKSGSSLVELRY